MSSPSAPDVVNVLANVAVLAIVAGGLAMMIGFPAWAARLLGVGAVPGMAAALVPF